MSKKGLRVNDYLDHIVQAMKRQILALIKAHRPTLHV
jgi:hypothetical protein